MTPRSAQPAPVGSWDDDRRRSDAVGVRVPDSAAARAAHDLIGHHADAMLYGHSARSYLFAVLLGRAERATWDEEALYVGCILHDIGLTAAFNDAVTDFEQTSAHTAADLTRQFDWPPARRDNVGRSIVMHMARDVAAGESMETRLLDAGVSCDVSGSRLAEIDDATRGAILEQFPAAGSSQSSHT